MKSVAKIHLSAEEAELIGNTEWILTKHTIIKKVYQLFGEVNELMKIEFACFDSYFDNTKFLNGKISKGENYRSLPYIILDYPAHFSKNNIFAVRTMFWWGNFFSVTLHLSGEHKMRFIKNDPQLISFLQKNDFFICVNEDEWEHSFEEKNYLPAVYFTPYLLGKVLAQPFFKVAKKLPVNQWENATVFITKSFKEVVEFLQFNFRDDKKDLSPASPITGSGL